jgi:hypothetical protein
MPARTVWRVGALNDDGTRYMGGRAYHFDTKAEAEAFTGGSPWNPVDEIVVYSSAAEANARIEAQERDAAIARLTPRERRLLGL